MTLPLPPLSSMHNLRYKNYFGKQSAGLAHQSLVSPCRSFSHLLAEFPSGVWRLAKPTNFAWASKIWPGEALVSPLLRENRRMPAAYIGGASSLSWNFIGFPCKPSYSASFLHWISSLSYPHLTTLYIFNSILSWSLMPSPLQIPWIHQGWTPVPFPIWNQSVVPCPVLTVASWPAYRFLKRQVKWSGTPISFRIFHSLWWSTQSKALA